MTSPEHEAANALDRGPVICCKIHMLAGAMNVNIKGNVSTFSKSLNIGLLLLEICSLSC